MQFEQPELKRDVELIGRIFDRWRVVSGSVESGSVIFETDQADGAPRLVACTDNYQTTQFSPTSKLGHAIYAAQHMKGYRNMQLVSFPDTPNDARVTLQTDTNSIPGSGKTEALAICDAVSKVLASPAKP